MISVYQFKPKFQQMLVPVLDRLHHKQLTANKLTIAGIIWSVCVSIFLLLSSQHPICLLAVSLGLFLRMAINALDGMMARKFHQQTELGEVLNEMGDLVSDTVIFCALFAFPFVNATILFLFIVLSLVNEFSGVLAKVLCGKRGYEGPMGKSDRALIVGFWCIFHLLFPSLYVSLNIMLIVAVCLLCVSTIKRLTNALKNK